MERAGTHTDLEQLEALLEHRFDRPELLEEALTHRSASNGARQGGRRGKAGRGRQKPVAVSYERLEFLGDRVLGLFVAEMLLKNFPGEAEGELARRYAELVRKETLASVATELGLPDLVRLPATEEPMARGNPSLLADVCEGVIAALYLDAGYVVARQFVGRYWTGRMTAAVAPPKDPKTALQEWALARGKPLPVYRLVKSEGPPHQLVFTVSVAVDGLETASATGTSKRLAEATAAALMLERLPQGSGRQGGPH